MKRFFCLILSVLLSAVFILPACSHKRADDYLKGEEIVIDNDRIYYLTESASKKYIFGNFIRGRHVYSLPLVH